MSTVLNKKVNLPIVGGVALGVVLLLIVLLFTFSGGVEGGVSLPSLPSFSGVVSGEEKSSLTISTYDTPLEGKLYIECDKSGRDYWTAWRYMYATPEEAMEVGSRLGLSGYHQHGELFMPGTNHFSYVQQDEIALRIPPQAEGRYAFYEEDADILTCFYTRGAEWNARAVAWVFDGFSVSPTSDNCVHKSSTFQDIALGADSHCAVIEIKVSSGDHTLVLVDLQEFDRTILAGIK